jgi:fumarate reductase flavoprotein subunit
MELPPGFRGYGKDMTVPHPETQIRQHTVDVIREKLEKEGASRFEIQQALMPFRDKLPQKYQGNNERLEGKI